MFDYCFEQVERAYKLIEDGETTTGLVFLAHLADILRFLLDAKSPQGVINISEFIQSLKDLDELTKDQIYFHLQGNGFGQYIPE